MMKLVVLAALVAVAVARPSIYPYEHNHFGPPPFYSPDPMDPYNPNPYPYPMVAAFDWNHPGHIIEPAAVELGSWDVDVKTDGHHVSGGFHYHGGDD